MERMEFAKVMAYISAICGKPMTLDQSEGYWDLLSDLPADAFQMAAKKVMLTHPYPTIPVVKELREATIDIVNHRNALPDAGEAWDIARRISLTMADESLDYKVVNGEPIPTKEWNARRLAQIPAAVAEALRQFGPDRICNTPNDQIGTAFAQFRSIYEACAAKVRENRLLPERVKQGIDRAAMPVEVQRLASDIGRLPS